jgi:hypothetical protein
MLIIVTLGIKLLPARDPYYDEAKGPVYAFHQPRIIQIARKFSSTTRSSSQKEL